MQYVFLFHCNNGCTNVPQSYVIRTLHVLFTAAGSFVKIEDRIGRVHTVKAYGGVQFELHSFYTWPLDGAEWLDSHIARFTTHGRNKWYPLNRRLGGPQSQTVLFGEGKNLLPLTLLWQISTLRYSLFSAHYEVCLSFVATSVRRHTGICLQKHRQFMRRGNKQQISGCSKETACSWLVDARDDYGDIVWRAANCEVMVSVTLNLDGHLRQFFFFYYYYLKK
jgi:hypothetical protein